MSVYSSQPTGPSLPFYPTDPSASHKTGRNSGKTSPTLTVTIPNGSGTQQIALRFSSQSEKDAFIKQIEQGLGKPWSEVKFFEISNFLRLPITSSDSLVYELDSVAKSKLKNGESIFDVPPSSVIPAPGKTVDIVTASGKPPKGAFFVYLSGGWVRFDSAQARDNFLKLAQLDTGKPVSELTVEDVNNTLHRYFPNLPNRLKQDDNYVRRLDKSTELVLKNIQPLGVPADFALKVQPIDTAILNIPGDDPKSLIQTLTELYSSSYLSEVDGDGTLQSMRFSAFKAGALHLHKANQATPGFNDAATVQVSPEVKELVKAIFGTDKVTNGHLSVLFQLGLATPGANGGYVLTAGGEQAFADSKVAASSNPAVQKFVPSVALLSLLSPTMLTNLAKSPDKAQFVREHYAAILKYNPTLVNDDREKFSGGRLQGNAQDVLDKIYGTKTSPVGAHQFSPYNATQVNLALAAGYLQIDSKGIITATDKGNQLLTPPKAQETSPVPSSPAGDYYKHLGVILGQPTDPNAPENDEKSDAVKRAKNIFFSDGKFDWKKVDAISKDTSDKYSDDEKKAAQYMLDNSEKLLNDPLFASLSVGFETKRDKKFSYTEALNVYRGLRTALRPSWNEPAAGAGVPKVNPQTKKPYTKSEYAALVLDNFKNKFGTHDRKNGRLSDVIPADSTQGPHYVSFSNDFIDDLKNSEDPDYIELGNQLAWLRDNCPDVWFLLKGNDDLVALSDLNAALGLLAPGNYQAPTPQPTAAPAA